VWYYNRQDLIESSQWTQRAFQRIKNMAQEGGFELFMINDASWKAFLPTNRQHKLEALAKELNKNQQELSAQ
jgi:hypothetical protein